jgi:hypothetical protein
LIANRCPSLGKQSLKFSENTIHIYTLDVYLIFSNTHQSTIISSDSLPSEADILACTTLLSPRDHSDKVVKLSDTLVAKYGGLDPVEAETMKYVAEKSDVPLTKVHGTLTNPVTKIFHIIMDFVPGETLEDMLPSVTQPDKDDIAQLIKTAVEKLRSMPEPGFLGSVDKKACPSGMFWSPNGLNPLMSGPFENEAAFKRWTATKSRHIETFVGHKTVMTQGDLQPKKHHGAKDMQ